MKRVVVFLLITICILNTVVILNYKELNCYFDNISNLSDVSSDVNNNLVPKTEYIGLSKDELIDIIDMPYKEMKSLISNDYNIINFGDEYNYMINEDDVVCWIECENKIENFLEITNIFGKGKMEKVTSDELKYSYYELKYEGEDVNTKFVSFYESGCINVCVITKNS